MPNWCDNTLTISHDDEKWWDWFMSTKFNFQKIVPCPRIPGSVWEPKNDDEEPWHRCYSSTMWGTKWTVNEEDLDKVWDKDAKGSMCFSFQTAWGPPLGIYKALLQFDFKIRASYLEEGCNFCGLWDNTGGDELFNKFLPIDTFDNSYKLDEVMPSYITTQEKWKKHIEGMADENLNKILEDYDWWIEDRLQWNRENNEEEESSEEE